MKISEVELYPPRLAEVRFICPWCSRFRRKDGLFLKKPIILYHTHGIDMATIQKLEKREVDYVIEHRSCHCKHIKAPQSYDILIESSLFKKVSAKRT